MIFRNFPIRRIGARRIEMVSILQYTGIDIMAIVDITMWLTIIEKKSVSIK